MKHPDYLFETSWEVCNRVGGIYAVLSTKARTMQNMFTDRVVFVGPDLGEQSDKYWENDDTLFPGWTIPANVRVGRWNIPGRPIALLVKYDHLWIRKDELYGWAWQQYGVQSHAAQGDYDDSALFGYAAGEVIHLLYAYIERTASSHVAVAHMHEWQTAFALFYLRSYCPDIATLFTTHATGIGRSIAGNGKPLYDYFEGYHGCQMAEELNMVSKHSAERQAAHAAHCFTTVSLLTARECAQLLDKEVDIVTPNGFEMDFVPTDERFNAQRQRARRALKKVAEQALQQPLEAGCRFVATAGRLEWRNKGIDVFLESMDALARQLDQDSKSPAVIAFVMIPYLDKPAYRAGGKLSVVFLPYYLDGHDPIVGLSYYDLLIGMDATVFPSYYEPWGYTPLEAIAFSVPTITTSLAGFGLWVRSLQANKTDIYHGVEVIDRNDTNRAQVADKIATTLYDYFHAGNKRQALARTAAKQVAEQALWSHFYTCYLQAYDIALSKK